MYTVFKKIASYLKYIGICIKYNVKSSFSNKKSFTIQAICMFINNFVFLIFWFALFSSKGGNINGIEITDILYVWSIPVISFGVALFFFGGVETIVQDIIYGKLDMYLVLPKHSLISVITSRSTLSAMGDILYGLVMGLFAVKFNVINYIFLLLISVLTSVIVVCVFCMFRLLCFWLGDISRLSDTYLMSLTLTFTIYPEKIFGTFSKFLMYTIVPAAYMAHIPIKILTDFNVKWLVIEVIVLIVFVAATYFIYELGLKKYESSNMEIKR